MENTMDWEEKKSLKIFLSTLLLKVFKESTLKYS